MGDDFPQLVAKLGLKCMSPAFWTKLLPTVSKEREARERKAGERETHIAVLRRELLQEGPESRPAGGLVGVQARVPQAQDFRILRKRSKRREAELGFSFLPLVSFPLHCHLFTNLEQHPSTPLHLEDPPSRSQGQLIHSHVYGLIEAGQGGHTAKQLPSYA